MQRGGLVRMVSISPDMDTSESLPYVSAIVFDWTNVLCPTTWLQGITLAAAKDGPEFHLVAASLRQLDTDILALLNHASRLGAVYITSIHTQAYLEQLCRAVLPRTGQLLFHPCSSVQLVCASSVPSPTWYAQVLQAIYTRTASHEGIDQPISVLAIGHDQTWHWSLAQVSHHVVPKRLVLTTLEPNLPDCIEKLKQLEAILDDVAFHRGPLHLVV
ncbi:hypothetical protein SDRG_14688 [Saprolegnia diclina VS20]|uniref:Uncharacterized protein n=1 Tax=Saprolegnia diclina (strain VS20) TaxID=1156394 RepID=T0Q297_SAPDV|nr:hypothetical protein SDRG_14688 [Saprolegnia diclina VS20]EQC27485.1 hypothetical protein SDRG_14688 [Saprolegnia diclina VS20]|eukprot:XP_008619059.1 hypothetical protein SDRG_14688 [Saprolegnia diclina VS20]